VIKAEIGKSDNPLLDDAARAAVLETRFMPVRRDGKATAVWVEVPVRFRLSK
jgi:TonB family protein